MNARQSQTTLKTELNRAGKNATISQLRVLRSPAFCALEMGCGAIAKQAVLSQAAASSVSRANSSSAV